MAKPRNRLKTFGQRIKKLRLANGLTQEGLAELSGFDRTYISLVERGMRNISLLNICKFAEALGVRPEVLLKNLGSGRKRQYV